MWLKEKAQERNVGTLLAKERYVNFWKRMRMRQGTGGEKEVRREDMESGSR